MEKDIFIGENASIKEALKKLNSVAEKILFVVDGDKHLLGTLTDGDIRRYIIKTGKLSGTIESVYNRNPVILRKGEVRSEDIRRLFIEKKLEVIPIVDRENRVVDYLTWTQLFSEKREPHFYKEIDVPVVIMAGGKGTRLSPFTYVLPKPLIPVGKKTILEHIIDRFRKFGVKKFFITLNYKGEVIEAYFKSLQKDYEVEFIWEKEFLGTAGSLKLLEDIVEKEDFFVSNCDILVDADYKEILDFHRDSGAIFTSVTAVRHYKIPYGVVVTSNGGSIERIIEKPEYSFQINTGVYLLNKESLKFIPPNSPFDMPQLINILLREKKKVLAYPVNECDYVDIGEWDEYKLALKKLSVGECVE